METVDIAVIDDPAAAAIALDPMRSRLLSELVEPSSAGALALRLGIPRQKLNYHLRALEAHGLLELAEERKRGGITERVLRATAVSYVVSPAALGESAADPDLTADHLSARYMVALAGRLMREVGSLAHRARVTGKRPPPTAINTETGFRSAKACRLRQVAQDGGPCALVARYHHDDGRPHRLVVAAHPRPEETP